MIPWLERIKNIEEAKFDMAAINIFYDDISYTLISETPVWNINTLLSNFGKLNFILCLVN
jgi:hypothetical protein